MWYVFKADGTCIATADSVPDEKDLILRGEVVFESDIICLPREASIKNGKVVATQQKEVTFTNNNIDPVILDFAEIIVAQDERIALQETRLLALENRGGGVCK